MAGIYLHIPFCKSRCIYCDFFSTTHHTWMVQYVEALCCELRQRQGFLQGEPIETIYLGGGTPSQLLPAHLEKIFSTLAQCYSLHQCCEVTIEVNPDDLTPSYIAALQTLPINRVSMGVQSFDDQRLRWLKRRHSAAQAIVAVQNLQRAGFENLSIDLIYGFPHQSLTHLQCDLQQALALQVPHISAYHLTYEEDTPLWQLYQDGAAPPQAEQQSIAMMELLMDTLTEAGYQHYEISNFARPHCHALHNSHYWNGTPYLGCGAGAHSFNGNVRQWGVTDLQQYMQGVMHQQPYLETEELDIYTRYNDTIVTTLRTHNGLSLQEMRQTYGEMLYNHCLKCAYPHIDGNRLAITHEQLHLTRAGLFVADAIMRDLLWV